MITNQENEMFNAYGTSPNDKTLAPLLGSFDSLEEAIDEMIVRKSGGGEVHVLKNFGEKQKERGLHGKWLKAAIHLGSARTKRTYCIDLGNVFEENYS